MKRKLFLILTFHLVFALSYADLVVYTADNTTVFRNPERGFTEELNGKVTVSNPYRIKNHIDEDWGDADCMTLPVVLYNLGNFKSQDLPEEILNGFDEDMQVLREMGLKCVLRFAYTEKESDKTDATPQWVKRHLEQLKSHLATNADVIYVIEAGFVGVWGEWYYSKNYGNETQHMNANRRKVVQYLFENVPQDRFVLFRYPMIKTEYLNDTTPLTATEAFSGSVKARMGCHNDAFLHDWGNMGTYAGDEDDDDPAVRRYVAAETLFVPNGGETNIDDDDALAQQRYAQAPSEMRTYHWSFCGSTYAQPVTNRWRNSGLFDTLNIYMGYRYNLLSGQYSNTAAPGGTMTVHISLRNVGYAPLYNERPVYVVLKNANRSYALLLQTDPRRWLPNGVTTTIDEQVNIPSDIAEGTYQLYLWMPDKYASIAHDPRYAVRLANTNVWDATTGYNDLGTTISISASAQSEELIRSDEIEHNRPSKYIENGIFFIRYPDGTTYTILGR